MVSVTACHHCGPGSRLATVIRKIEFYFIDLLFIARAIILTSFYL